MSELVIEASCLSKDHTSDFLRKKNRVLHELNLRVFRNETFGLLGVNGAGKTTTLKLLLGLLRPTSGRISILGYPAGHPAALVKIGFLPEQPYFYQYLTAYEFLDFMGRLFDLPTTLRKERCENLLSQVNMTAVRDLPVHKFSKGMMQRLGIAQALINDPEVIFFDEPMSALDPIGRRDVKELIHKLKSAGKTIFLNSHLLPDVNEICDRIGILHQGKLVSEKAIAEVSSRKDYRTLEDYFLEVVAEADNNLVKH